MISAPPKPLRAAIVAATAVGVDGAVAAVVTAVAVVAAAVAVADCQP